MSRTSIHGRQVRVLALAALLVGAAGCAGPCETATCLGERAVADWASDRARVTDRVRAIPDEFTRTVVVAALCEAYPGATRELCAALPPGPSRQRCERLNNRPHLSVVPGAAAIGTGGAAGDVPVGGEAEGAAPPSGPVPSFPDVRLPVATATAPPDTCAEVADRAACLDQAALDAALAGDVAVASAICAEHPRERWADECRFSVAEEVVRAKRGAAYATAAALCGTSSRFSQECWSHVLSKLPRAAPPPDASAAHARAAVALAKTIRETWTPAGEDVADAHVQRFWALYFANVYRHAPDADGTPLGVYPEEAWPHIRAAATVRLHALGRLRGSFEEQRDALVAAMAHRRETRPARGEGADLVFVPEVGAPVSPGPTTFFLGAPRRATADDESTDLLYCLIESAARTNPPDTTLLEEATRRPEPRVAEEAKRLLEALGGRGG